jgi:hypothetical protein
VISEGTQTFDPMVKSLGKVSILVSGSPFYIPQGRYLLEIVVIRISTIGGFGAHEEHFF